MARPIRSITGIGEDDRQRHRIVDERLAGVAEPGLQVGLVLEGVEEGHVRVLDLGRQGQDLLKGDGAEGAEHEQRAMGEVDHAQRAEDQGQAERDQRVGAALVEPVQDLKNDRVKHEPYPRRKTVFFPQSHL